MEKLSPEQIAHEVTKLPDWKIKEARLLKEFKFSNFPTAILFINKLVDPCEELNHHPQIVINYNRVHVLITTHQVGGLTLKDFELARRIDEIE